MQTAEREKLKEIFEAAVDLPLPERVFFLDLNCAENSPVRGEIEKLLAADDAAGGFLESSPFGAEADNFAKIRSQKYIGQQIGAYRIEREIGVGGMGTVFLAMREIGEIKQQVAVKIVNQAGFSQEIVRRFLIERKILAELAHSGIARLIDAGETADGLPFLVMEYVAGVSLDEYCRRENLSLDGRLQLFRKVCAAVAYAHRRLIIHRDLKPSNVLVTAEGEPKLLDFGIAKLLSPSAENAQTATLMNLLTPAYAAPEQIRADSVTTATDVYSLGVILYELLTGERPFSFGTKNYQEIVRVICETEPPPPSSVISGKLAADDVNTAFQKSPPTDNFFPKKPKFIIQNPKSLRGDLDNIILKALRKDAERRYQSVEQLSEDIERYRKGLPVSARPDTFSYRAAKFFERNRAAVVSFGIIMVLLVAGIFGTTWEAFRAERQQRVAEQRFAQVREIANNVIFKYHDSIANLNGSTEVRKMLVEDSAKYLDQLAQESDTDEDLQNELALSYAKLADVQGKPYAANTGDSSGALKNYGKSIKLLENLAQSKIAANSFKAEEELIPTYHSYSALNCRMSDYEEAVSSQSKALDLAGKHLALDPQNTQKRVIFARATMWLGDAYSESGDFAQAVESYRQAVGLSEEINQTAPDDKEAQTLLGVSHDRIGRSLLRRGQELARTDFPPEKIDEIFRQSYPHLEKSYEIFKKVAAENPGNQKYQRNFVDGQSNLGVVLGCLGEFARSLEMLRQSDEIYRLNLEKDAGNRQLAADRAVGLHEQSLTLAAGNDYVKAVKILEPALRTMDGLIAQDPANTEFRRIQLAMIDSYGNFFFKRGDINGALKIYQPALEQFSNGDISENTFGSYATGLINENIGDCYRQLAGKPLISKTEKEIYLQKAEKHYLETENLWQPVKVRNGYLNRTPETLDYLAAKLSDTKRR